MGINENCKYFIVALIETISFNFRLDIGPTNLNDMDEFVPVTKHMNSTESKIQIHIVKKNKKKTANCLLKPVSIIFYQFLFFHQMITLHELWKMFFISSKKLLSFSRYSNFYDFLPSFTNFPHSKGQLEVE